MGQLMKNKVYISKNFALFVCFVVLLIASIFLCIFKQERFMMIPATKSHLLSPTNKSYLLTPTNGIDLMFPTRKPNLISPSTKSFPKLSIREYTSPLCSKDNETSIKETQTYIAKPPVDTCDGVKITVLVKSSAQHSEQRQVIRNTWASVHNVSGNLIRTIFLLGDTGNQITNLLLAKEAYDHKDIVIGTFVDTYLNLTLKSVFGLRWIRDYCRETSFVLLGDDDAYVKLSEIATHYLAKIPSGKKILHCGVGMFRKHEVRRSGRHKVPVESYAPLYYPHYCSGPCCFMSTDVAQSISDAYTLSPESVTVITVEDALLTGIIREQIGLPLASMPNGLCEHFLNTKEIKEKLTKAWERENIVSKKKLT